MTVTALLQGSSLIVAAIVTLQPSIVAAQAAPAVAASDEQASYGDDTTAEKPATTQNATPAAGSTDGHDVVVTGSRLDLHGFDAPTPTTVIGALELREGHRATIGEVLADQPQFVLSGAPTQTTGNTNNSAESANLRGLGSNRTLTLLGGRRTITEGDLNSIPQSLIGRIEVVTGGASAAWGSGAVAGVTNIILNDKLKGLEIGVQSGISTHGDGFRYGANASYGTDFAGGRGHFMVAAEYLRDEGIFGRDNGTRPYLDAGLFPDGDGLRLVNNVNALNATTGGVITSGILAGMQFNKDGTLSPVSMGSVSAGSSTIGGNGRSQLDFLPVSSPYHRVNAYARATYDLTDTVKVWADASFARMNDNFKSFPEVVYGSANSGIAIRKDNAFLSPEIRAQLASGPDTFYMGRFFGDPGGMETYKYRRNTYEGSIGIDGSLGSGWSYSLWYNHGELHNRDGFYNQRIQQNYLLAKDAVFDPSGKIVCRIALTDPSTACRPLNLFGEGNSSAPAIAYAFADESQVYMSTVQRLDATGATLRGTPFSTWAGPVSIAVGVEARWEKFLTTSHDPLSAAGALGSFNNNATNGAFNVKEGFGEINVPLIDVSNAAVVTLNGAARYSDYSTSGGIWSWKGGATARLVNDILLRGVYSRDIRSPNIFELYSVGSQGTTSVSDPSQNYAIVPVLIFAGGNPNVKPEISHTLSLGATYSPHFIPGLNLSLDYYRIHIDRVITALGAQDIVNQCFEGRSEACAAITRDSNGNIATISTGATNLASFKTSGWDFEASYVMPFNKIINDASGNLRFRVLANKTNRIVFDDGVNVVDYIDGAPKVRATGSLSYQGDTFGTDFRVRYVASMNFAPSLPISNNHFHSRTYFDVGAQVKVAQFTIFANVNNLLDRKPPFVIYASDFHDVVGRYFSGGVKLKF